MKWIKLFLLLIILVLVSSNYSCEKSECLYMIYPQNQGFFQATNVNAISVDLVIDGLLKETLSPNQKSKIYNLYFGEHTWKFSKSNKSCELQIIYISDCKSLISQSCLLQ